MGKVTYDPPQSTYKPDTNAADLAGICEECGTILQAWHVSGETEKNDEKICMSHDCEIGRASYMLRTGGRRGLSSGMAEEKP